MQRPPSSGRFERALIPREPAVDPREREPNAGGAGPNVPPSTVGPTSSEGFGNTHVMYPAGWPPPQAEAWSGWPVEWATPWMEPTPAHSTFFGHGHDPHLFGRVSTLMTCVDRISSQIASFPVYAMSWSEPLALPGWSINPEPELYDSWADFVQGAVNSLLLRGECILYVTGRFADGWPARFAALNPDYVDIELIDGRRVVTLAGEEIPAGDVSICRYQSWPGRPRGVSPLEWIGRSLVTSEALETYASKLAARGGIPWAVLKSQGNINAQQAGEAQALWRMGAQSRDGAPAVLGGLFELQPLTISPRDMALLELREFDERRITAALRMPAGFVNVAMADGLTYSTTLDMRVQTWQVCLRPVANLLAAAWSQFLLPHGQRLEFNPDRFLQPPLAERAQYYQTLHNIVDPATGERVINVAEIRTAERLTTTVAEPAAIDAERLTGATV